LEVLKLLDMSVLTWRFLSQKTKLYFILSILLMPIIAFIELIQVATIVPLMTLLADQTGEVSISGFHINTSLFEVALFFAIVSLTLSVFRFIGLYISNYAALKSLENISTSIFTQRVYGDFSDARNRRVSDTMNLFSNKLIYVSAHFIYPVLTIIQSIITGIAIVILLVYQISDIFPILAFSLLALYSAYTYFSKSRTRVNAEQITHKTQQHSAIVAGLSKNIRELKLYGREAATLDQFRKPIIEGLTYVSLAAIIIYSIEAEFANLIPKLALLAFGVQKLLPAAQSVYSSYSLMVSGTEMLKEIFSVLLELKTHAVNHHSHRKEELSVDAVDSVYIKELEFMSNGEKPLKYPTHEFKIGKLNLIVGKSGTGKTTLIDLITGLLKHDKGKIIYSKKDQKVSLEKIAFAYCSQTPIIFDDDLLNLQANRNVKKELNGAVDLKFLNNKSEIHTDNLSGGERQRIGIARALLSDSSIYVFDEPTASLDEVNANKIIDELKNFSKSKLVIVVSHDSRIISQSENILDLN
jgi:ABC-type transport system involved in cytochrome bd biosynthesis fused ATPase/permease subunit